MAKLYPPYLNGTIPAFYYVAQGTTEIVVPFSMNKAVAPSEVAGFVLKVKKVDGNILGVFHYTSDSIVINSNASVTFSISTNKVKFTAGQFYKVQLAYKDKNGSIGYYSTVAIAKCTTKPVVKIEQLNFGENNHHRYSYVGSYSQYKGDVTEKLYSYQFILFDYKHNIVVDSGEKLYDTSNDNISYESHIEFSINYDLDLHHIYYLQFIAKTVNGAIVKSYQYKIIQKRSVTPDIHAELIAGRDFNNGYIILSLIDEKDPVISGTFLISRASSKDGYKWEEIKRIELTSVLPEDWSYKDYTVEQGITYKYSLQQYNSKGVYSDRIISNYLMMDFEDMFLYDGTKQLRIRYNPKVSTFKTDLLEVKTDTIGSQFPFFSRNGNVNYKEFAISGLISYLADESENFVSMTELGLDGFSDIVATTGKYHTTNLVDYNMAAERIFKNKVLDWLNDGQVKLFKSPAEGNFLVRLMNISLTPTDSLSRLLHTFSASAYEVAKFNLENLAYYGLIDTSEKLEVQTRWVTVDFTKLVDDYLSTSGKNIIEAIGDKLVVNTREAVSVDFRDMTPGAHIYLNGENIQIGATGAYHFEPNGYTIQTIEYVIDIVNEGQITYGYTAQAVTTFGAIDTIDLVDVPLEQLIGNAYRNRAKIWNSKLQVYDSSTDVFDYLNDARTTVLNIVALRAEKRSIETLYMFNPGYELTLNNFNVDDFTFYTDIYCTKQFFWKNADPLAIYRIRYRANTSPYNIQKNYRYYVDANLDQFAYLTNMCIDGNTKEIFIYNDDIFRFEINYEVIDLLDIEKFKLRNEDVNINRIISNHGVILELTYSKQIKTFNMETAPENIRYPALVAAKNSYEGYVNQMNTIRQRAHYDTTNLKAAYNKYILEINKALDKYREENGLVE